MTYQERTFAQAELRGLKNTVAQVEKVIPPDLMEPAVKAIYEAKKRRVAELGKVLGLG